MTGWAQVNGLRGETARVESMARRVAMDLFYIQHWSFWLDLKIVAMTIVKGFTGKNAY
jgi:putative colanic acid biosynthesis UDP-glucose lipid carrier transferase